MGRIVEKAKIAAGLTVVLSVLMLVFGCGGSTADKGGKATTAKAAAKQYFIGCSFDYVSDFMSYVNDGALNYGKDHDNVKVVVEDANFNVAKQLQDVENFISQGVDAILMKSVDKEACEPISKACKDAGIPLVLCNAAIKSDYNALVGSDNVYAGEIQGDFIGKALNGKGNVALLIGDLANMNAVKRVEGVKAAFQKYPEIKIVSEQVASWMRDKAMATAENWLQTGLSIDAIIANNDEMAIGAILAYKESGKKILVAGVNGSVEALDYLESGDMALSVFQNGYGQGYYGVETAVKLVSGEKVDKFVPVPFEPVTKDVVGKYRAMYKK